MELRCEVCHLLLDLLVLRGLLFELLFHLIQGLHHLLLLLGLGVTLSLLLLQLLLQLIVFCTRKRDRKTVLRDGALALKEKKKIGLRMM